MHSDCIRQLASGAFKLHHTMTSACINKVSLTAPLHPPHTHTHTLPAVRFATMYTKTASLCDSDGGGDGGGGGYFLP